MIVQCPACKTTYNVNEAQIGPTGSKVRCSRCKHVFAVSRSEPEKPVGGEELPGASFDDELEHLFAEKSAAGRASSTSPASSNEDMLEDLRGAFQPSLLDHAGSNAASHDEGAAKNKSRSFLVIGLLTLVVLLAIGAGLYIKYYVIPDPTTGNTTGAATPSAEMRSGVAQIALENVRQYFVPNEKEGQLFIIEGSAVNHFPEPRELVRLKASLFDRQGAEVLTQEFMCGNVVSLYQLQVSTRKEIEEALAAKVGILTNNTNVQPGAAVPFMVVFFKTPETVEEFGLEVIQSQAPEK